MTAAVCRHCGDHTDPDDDPATDLCVMCAKAGRTAQRPLRVNGKPIPRDIANGSPGDFARFCGETDPAVLAILDAEGEDVD